MGKNDDLVNKYGQPQKETEQTISPEKTGKIKQEQLENQAEKHGATMEAYGVTTDGKNLNANDIPSHSNIPPQGENNSTNGQYLAKEKEVNNPQQGAAQIGENLKASGVSNSEGILAEHGQTAIGKSPENDKGFER